jgi:virulence factor Mce-like protein
MRSRSRQQSAFANPVLVGAVTVLAILVAVFLAYNANAGLPFVPTKQLKVDIGDGSNVVIGNDVREGGFRIGLVSAMKPIELPSGQVGAQLTLQLDQGHGNVPKDSTVTILPRSVLGLKYVSLTRGTAKQTIPDGGTLPIGQTSVPVQFDDIFKTFDPKTRNAIQKSLVGTGDTLTARGSSLNDTIHSLPELFLHLRPVAQYLSDPSTELTRFLDSLNGFMSAISPVAPTAARLFTDAATTFEAISRDPRALEQTIAESPSTLDVSTNSLMTQQPFLVDLTTLGTKLAPATSELHAALPDINPAIEAGTKTLKRTPTLNAKLQDVMSALKGLARDPATNMALNALSDTVGTLNPMVRYLGPYVTVCNSWNYFWTFLSEHISEETTFGFAQRALLNQTNPVQTNNIGSQGAYAPVNGGVPDTQLFGGNAYLHGPAYGAAIDNQGNADCEIGQRGYPKKLNYFDPQGRNLDSDPHTPGNQGTTFTGRPHVPKGETFSRNPQFGPQLLKVPYNP